MLRPSRAGSSQNQEQGIRVPEPTTITSQGICQQAAAWRGEELGLKPGTLHKNSKIMPGLQITWLICQMLGGELALSISTHTELCQPKLARLLTLFKSRELQLLFLAFILSCKTGRDERKGQPRRKRKDTKSSGCRVAEDLIPCSLEPPRVLHVLGEERRKNTHID